MAKQAPPPRIAVTPAEGLPGPTNSLSDVPGIRIGHAHDAEVRTGVTVILPDAPMTCAVDVRGGGPGTRETDLLNPATLVQTVDAIVLAGGSTYGLAAADAVTAELGASGHGFALVARAGVPKSPIVPAAILYDLANGGNKKWKDDPPYARLGRVALDRARQDQHDLQPASKDQSLTRTPLAQGRAGAAFGAMAGQVAGGLGSVSAQTATGEMVAALMAVNSFGSVFMPQSDVYWAWPFEQNNAFGGRSPATNAHGNSKGLPCDTKLGPRPPHPRENTTIGVVAVSVPLSQAEATRIAIMAQDGMARAIRPVHAPTDGDVIFVLAPPPEPNGASVDILTLTSLGTLAADCVARAIARGVHEANRERT